MNGTHPSWTMNTLKIMGILIRPLIPQETFSLTPILMNLVTMSNRSLSILDTLDETPKISPIHNLLVNKHVFQ